MKCCYYYLCLFSLVFPRSLAFYKSSYFDTIINQRNKNQPENSLSRIGNQQSLVRRCSYGLSLQLRSNHWRDDYLQTEDIKDLSQQPIPYSTLQRYQVSALEIYARLAESIHRRKDEPLEERLFHEFTTGAPTPLKHIHIEVWLSRARKYRDQGMFSQAMELNQRCANEDPTDHRPIIGNAMILWKLRKVDECVRILQQGLQRVRNEPHLIQYLAVTYMKIGRAADATNILKLGLEEYPKHSPSWLTLATLHLTKGDISAARTCYSTAVQNDPSAYACYHAWAALELDSGDLAFAKELISKALQISPNSHRSWYLVGSVLIQEKKYKEAQEFLQQCIAKAPTLSRLYALLLTVYERRLQYIDPKLIEEVEQKLLHFGKMYGDSKSILDLASFEQRQLRRFQLKINDFLINSGLSPVRIRDQQVGIPASLTALDNKELLSSLPPIYQPIESDAMIFYLGRRMNPGTYLYEFYQLLQTQNHSMSQPNQIIAYGLFKKLQEQLSRIRYYYQFSIQSNKYYVDNWIRWSNFEKLEGNYDIARKILIAGIEKFPSSRSIGKFHVALGDLATLTVETETARSCYDRALQLCPRHLSLPIYCKYYEMELLLGNAVKAGKILQQALNRFPSKYEHMIQIRRRYIKDELSV